ncbi:atp-dependent rna helicase chl-1 [Cystoisospora suis]|uniref:Atp-dependent rna helicase chl-1 n=1 Tax=Cystoisospora suis TaxID=483139 RepID=A0A2C6L109_9APIC|nr:atp-dependent rna helicase chl-1 [Cystoisospora suis]
MGGTMTPSSRFEPLLRGDPSISSSFSFGVYPSFLGDHVISPDRLFIQTLSKTGGTGGLQEEEFDFSFSQRGRFHDQYKDILHLLVLSLQHIPRGEGVVLFFTSFSQLKEFRSLLVTQEGSSLFLPLQSEGDVLVFLETQQHAERFQRGETPRHRYSRRSNSSSSPLEIVCGEGMDVFTAYKEAIKRASRSDKDQTSSQERKKETEEKLYEETSLSSSFSPCVTPTISSSSLFVGQSRRTALNEREEEDFAYRSEKNEKRKIFPNEVEEKERRFPRSHLSSKKIRAVVLLCVMSGSLSEGVNFNDSLARLIFLIGLPYPNIKDPEFQLRSSHFHRLILEKQREQKIKEKEEKDGQEVRKQETTSSKLKRGVYTPGETEYALGHPQTTYSSYGFLQCMQTINQTIGRSIRHKGDYSCVFLIDRRYKEKSVQSCLSKWIQDSLHYYQNVSAETFNCIYTSGEQQGKGEKSELREGEKEKVAQNLERFFHKMSLLHKEKGK